jgi:anthranilate synthase component II
MLVLIDNYDSFTYNLVHYLGELGGECRVFRNDKITAAEVLRLKPKGIVLSPGPCTPNEAGICLELIEKAGPAIPLLGVCLGHQAIGLEAGGEVERTEPVHGKATPVFHEGRGILHGVASPFEAGRYHSLVVRRDDLPTDLELTAWTEDGLVMGTQHRSMPRFGVQFHPESILTPDGPRIVENFLDLVTARPRAQGVGQPGP